MIIRGLFKRYKRWNPVHPTLGTFWGIGIGVGCGVGWGPGFGPEVIGYVGAGCGVGFSVGITLAGFGVGLPVNSLIQIPYNAFPTSTGAIGSEGSNSISTAKILAEDSRKTFGPQLSSLKEDVYGRFSRFRNNIPPAHGLEIAELNKAFRKHIQSALEYAEAFRERYCHSNKDQ